MTEPSQETKASNIIKKLKMFNRKERDHLMKFALCEDPKTPRISNALWRKISNGGTRPNADKMFIGMDYHLNWLYAALATAEMSDEELEAQFDNQWQCEKASPGESENERPIQKNQQDVDLLIAWFDRRWEFPFRLVLVEAKLDSSWGSAQIKSKREKLTLIRYDALGRGLNFINWQFLLMSPGDCPSLHEFDADCFDKPYDWMLHQKKTTEEKGQLWHQRLPVTTHLRRVRRVSEESDKWEIV